jgi:hypothetical protein
MMVMVMVMVMVIVMVIMTIMVIVIVIMMVMGMVTCSQKTPRVAKVIRCLSKRILADLV